jgi:hypothetical protein
MYTVTSIQEKTVNKTIAYLHRYTKLVMNMFLFKQALAIEEGKYLKISLVENLFHSN